MEDIRPKILLITAMGAAMFIVGMALFAFTEQVEPYMRFLLPLPPLSVAAYIYMLNRMGETDALAGALTFGEDVMDLLLQTVIGTASFLVVVFLMMLAFSVATRLSDSPAGGHSGG